MGENSTRMTRQNSKGASSASRLRSSAEEFLPSANRSTNWPRLDTPTHFTHRCDFQRLRRKASPLVSRVYVIMIALFIAINIVPYCVPSYPYIRLVVPPRRFHHLTKIPYPPCETLSLRLASESNQSYVWRKADNDDNDDINAFVYVCINIYIYI